MRRAKPLAFLATTLTAFLALSVPASAGPEAPRGRTPESRLAPAGLNHHEVLRIDPDGLGPGRSYGIVIDGWTAEADPSKLEDVRMWWIDRAKSDERSPFGKTVRKRMKIKYRRSSDRKMRIEIKTGKDAYTFKVVATKSGKVRAYGTIVDKFGRTHENCRAVSSRIVAKRRIGIPVGMEELNVTCFDAEGKRRKGRLVSS